METILRFTLFLAGAQVALHLFVWALPWLLAFAIIAGLVAGVTASFFCRRQLPPPPQGGELPPYAPRFRDYRTRRPRGRGEWR